MSWLKKKKLQRQMQYNKSTTGDRIWCFYCQHVLEWHSFSNSWQCRRGLESTQVFLLFFFLFVLTGTNRLPAAVSLTTARLSVQSSVFLWTARTEVRQLSFWNWCGLSGKRQIISPSIIFQKPIQTGGVITPCHYSFKWCCRSRWAEFEKDI